MHLWEVGPPRLRLLGEAKLRTGGVKNNVLAFEEDISEGRETHAIIALNATKAGSAARGNRRVINQRPGDNGLVATDGYAEVR